MSIFEDKQERIGGHLISFSKDKYGDWVAEFTEDELRKLLGEGGE